MMDSRKTAGKLAIVALTVAVASQAAPQRSVARGRLVVHLVVDQLRYQDVLWLQAEWGAKGFAGLGRPMPMRYQTLVTETAADHAVLGTGTYADVSGIIGNRYVDNNQLHEMVEDPACGTWGAPKIGKSAALLRVPTVGDALKLGTNGRSRVVAIAIKDRAALFVGGVSADYAIWLDPDVGQLVSTSCYAKEPPAWLATLNREHPLSDLKAWLWKMQNPEIVTKYAPQGQTAGATPWNAIGPVFPHQVGKGLADKNLALAIRETPASTEVALRAAKAAVEGMQLGDRDAVDLLGVSLPSIDFVGHQFGTVSRERVDALLRMHTQLSELVTWLRARFGSRVSFVLAADHGASPSASDQRRLKVPYGGTLDIKELTAKVNKSLEQAIGPREGGWVLRIDGNSVWLRKPLTTHAIEIAAETLRREPGVYAVYSREQMPAAPPEVRHSYFPGRSGDLLLVPRPLWTLLEENHDVDHGSPWNDDALVPFFVAAPGFKVRHDQATLRATQMAPTVAALLQVSPPAAAFDDAVVEPE